MAVAPRVLLLIAALSSALLVLPIGTTLAASTAPRDDVPQTAAVLGGTAKRIHGSAAPGGTNTQHIRRPDNQNGAGSPSARMSAAGLHQPLERLRVSAVTQRMDPGIIITPDRTTLDVGSGEWFNVSWSGVPNPMFDDWIAVIVPADANLTETAPAKWKFAAGDPQHITTGSGSLRFRVISYRADFAFALLRGGFDTPVEVARSPPVKVTRPNEPLQLHLALTGNPGEMAVQWNTRDAGAAPQVRWGPAPVSYGGRGGGGGGGGDGGGPRYPHAANASSFRYEREDMCGGAATTVGWVEPGSHHVGVMSGLQPASRYYYRVGDAGPGGGGWSEEHYFWSAPAASPDTAVRILAVADMGQGEVDGSLEGSEMMASLSTTDRMASEGSHPHGGRHHHQHDDDNNRDAAYTLLLHNGDISYARGYVTQWDNFMAQIQPLASRMPYMVAPGNHERDWPGSGDAFGVQDSGGECGVAFERRFPMPYPGRDKLWYSFEYGPVFFLQYSTEHPFGPGTEQYEYIVQALGHVDRRRTPWLVVGGHRPLYVASTNSDAPAGDQPVAQALREAFEDMFLEHGVDLTLHGHHHSYQRTCHLYRSACQPPPSRQQQAAEGAQAAPVHLVIGHAGAGLSMNIADPAPEWLEVLGLWWGYLRLHVSGTQLTAQVVSDEGGALMDEFALTKPEGWGRAFMERRSRTREAAAAAAAAAAQRAAAAAGAAGATTH